MKCSAENCKNYEEVWCEYLRIGNKGCFDPVKPVSDSPNNAPEAVLSVPEVFQGGEIPHTAPETLKTAKSAKTAYHECFKILVDCRGDVKRRFDKAFDLLLKLEKGE